MVTQNNSFFLISAVLAVLVVTLGCDSTKTKSPESSKHTTDVVAGTVELKVIFNSERENISVQIPCSKGSTVLDILKRAQMVGDIKFAFSGAGATAFVGSIGGVDNLRSEGDNWIYKVNDELGDKSCGEYLVQPGDEIQWSFGKYP